MSAIQEGNMSKATSEAWANPFDEAIEVLETEAKKLTGYANEANTTIESNARYKREQLKRVESHRAAIRVLEAAGKVDKHKAAWFGDGVLDENLQALLATLPEKEEK
jgi:hypothetical protein